jgi:hypothetical protein
VEPMKPRELRKRGRDAQMHRHNSEDEPQMLTTEGYIMSSSKERMIFLLNSSILSSRLPFCGGILQFKIIVAQVVG